MIQKVWNPFQTGSVSRRVTRIAGLGKLAYASRKEGVTFDADRSHASRLAVCRYIGRIRLSHDPGWQPAVVWPPLDGLHPFGATVRRTNRVLDLLSAPRASAEDDQHAGRARQHGSSRPGSARCAGSAAKTAQPGHRHYASTQSRHRCHAPCWPTHVTGAGCARHSARRLDTLDLRATARMMFSPADWMHKGSSGRPA